MKNRKRILIAAGCAALLLIAWVIAATTKSDVAKQNALMKQAAALLGDYVYVGAVPLLEEAAGYNTKNTYAIEGELKKTYLALVETYGYRRKYTDLLEKQMNRRDAPPDVFAEAAEYYIGISRIPAALEILKTGIDRTGSEDLIAIYETNRYAFETSRTNYDYISEIFGETVKVRIGGLWGIASYRGALIIPCIYENISTFYDDRAIVDNGSEIYAVNTDNNRVAKLHEQASAFGNYSDDRVPIYIAGAWRRVTGGFLIGTTPFEELGMYSEGYAAAKVNGKWGVIDLMLGWCVPPEYDAIIKDELGRCYSRGAVFARQGDGVLLLVRGRQTGDIFDDARPFSDEGYAAVKKNGKWGFIDINGTLMIDYQFDDALSFGQHLAAVKLNGLWGYISISGNIVIEPAYLEARSFSQGSAPVLAERGWQVITLLEYKTRAGVVL